MSLPKARIPWPRDELARTVARLRKKGLVESVVLVDGGFDTLRGAQVRGLQAAAEQGQMLIVALRSDAAERKLKGAGHPAQPLRERAELVAALRCVDAVTSFGEATAERTLRVLRPDVHALGIDALHAAAAGRKTRRSRGR